MITLRQYQHKDIERLAALANDVDVQRYMTDTFPYPYTLEDADWWVSTGSLQGVSRVIERDHEFVGGIGATFCKGVKHKQFIVGYWLGKAYWHQGIAAQALKIFTRDLFDNHEVIRLQASVYSPNHASMRVLQKAGFEQEAVLKQAIYKNGEVYDEHIFCHLGA